MSHSAQQCQFLTQKALPSHNHKGAKDPINQCFSFFLTVCILSCINFKTLAFTSELWNPGPIQAEILGQLWSQQRQKFAIVVGRCQSPARSAYQIIGTITDRNNFEDSY